MPTHRYATFEVIVPAAREDEACAVLWELGTVGIEVGQSAEGDAKLTASFAVGPEVTARLGAALSAIPGVRVRPIELPEVDWVARFRADFRAFEAAGFTVVPEWDGRPAGADVIVIDPGRAFGTGTHETTRLCLGLLVEEAARRPLSRVIDVGAGTGLLAIAALRRGARVSVAADIDPEATASSALHARLNRVPLHVVQADGGGAFRVRGFDVVLANLMAPLLIERGAELRGLGAPGATLILSGLLTEDLSAVTAAYAEGTVEARVDGGWAALRVRLA